MRKISLALVLALTACGNETDQTDTDMVEAVAQTANVEASSIKTVSVMAEENDKAARVVSWKTDPQGSAVSLTVTGPRPGENAIIAADSTTDGAFIFTPEENLRRYFTVEVTGGDTVTSALRVLPLEGGRNFRDLGGYKTEDGRTVKWGQVYRSGVLNGLADADYQFIEGLDIATVVDFRATSEQEQEATDWRAGEVEILAWDYEMEGASELFAIFQKPGVTPADVTGVMTEFYYGIVEEHADKYEVMFDRLITSDAPLAFHCSAGKDRTGVAAALVLSALGVPRETIVEDYAMSEQVVDYMADMVKAREEMDKESPYAFLAQLPPELVSPLMRSNPAYIEATLDTLEEKHGSVLNFIQTELGVDDQELSALRDRLLD